MFIYISEKSLSAFCLKLLDSLVLLFPTSIFLCGFSSTVLDADFSLRYLMSCLQGILMPLISVMLC
eukprot:snap_masked-scaffold_10-processed-gene-2.26-mRNA-1 protein AED:1.00 eAED:1.00 QI:0/0/0/0/1/1/2/0/65